MSSTTGIRTLRALSRTNVGEVLVRRYSQITPSQTNPAPKTSKGEDTKSFVMKCVDYFTKASKVKFELSSDFKLGEQKFDVKAFYQPLSYKSGMLEEGDGMPKMFWEVEVGKRGVSAGTTHNFEAGRFKSATVSIEQSSSIYKGTAKADVFDRDDHPVSGETAGKDATPVKIVLGPLLSLLARNSDHKALMQSIGLKFDLAKKKEDGSFSLGVQYVGTFEVLNGPYRELKVNVADARTGRGGELTLKQNTGIIRNIISLPGAVTEPVSKKLVLNAEDPSYTSEKRDIASEIVKRAVDTSLQDFIVEQGINLSGPDGIDALQVQEVVRHEVMVSEPGRMGRDLRNERDGANFTRITPMTTAEAQFIMKMYDAKPTM